MNVSLNTLYYKHVTIETTKDSLFLKNEKREKMELTKIFQWKFLIFTFSSQKGFRGTNDGTTQLSLPSQKVVEFLRLVTWVYRGDL